jgi:hypothetical protein
MATEAPKFKSPKKCDGTVADRYYTLMQKRLELNRLAAEIEAEEKFLKAYIIDTLPMSNATGIAGHLCRVSVVPKVRPDLTDFDLFTEFVAKNRKKGTFALLNRALNAKSVKEYWDAGKEVPGVIQTQYKSLSYSKIG